MQCTKIILASFALFILLATTVSAVSYTDDDGDGICEPGEEITFYGDDHFDYYDWDFDGDGLPEDNGQVVSYTFEEEGNYLVTVIQTNGVTKVVELNIEIKEEESSENTIANAIATLEGMKPTRDQKLDRLLNKAIKELYKAIDKLNEDKVIRAFNKIAKAIKYLRKAQRNGAATQDVKNNLVDLLEDMVDQSIKDAIEKVGMFNKHVQRAQKHYNKALEKLLKGKCVRAIRQFTRAYRHSIRALKCNQ